MYNFSLRFLGIILRVLRLEVSVYNVYITGQFQTIFSQWVGGGVKLVEVNVNGTEDNPITSRNSASSPGILQYRIYRILPMCKKDK